MNKVTLAIATLIAVIVTACVTINVYFPEAAATEAADKIINTVRGESEDNGALLFESLPAGSRPTMLALAHSIAGFFISDANAQSADFDKPSPEKTALVNSLKQRQSSLDPFFNSGAIGVTESGLIEIRDRALVPLKDRNTVVQLVNEQNKDWNALYAEIARLNGHPEWQDDIRRTFAQRWVASADKGWYYRANGQWKQK